MEEIESESGASKGEQFVEVLTTKAFKRKNAGKEIIQGREIVNTSQLTFLLRYNPLIKEDQIVEYDGSDYTIDFLDSDKHDRSIEIRLNRKDK